MRGAVGIFVGTPFLHIRRTRTSTVANTYVNVSLAVVMTAMSFVSGGFSMKASIQAVAAEAGVSISTVSRTFAKPNLVLPETRSKVMAAAEKLDYRISRSAAALKTGQSFRVALLMSDPIRLGSIPIPMPDWIPCCTRPDMTFPSSRWPTRTTAMSSSQRCRYAATSTRSS